MLSSHQVEIYRVYSPAHNTFLLQCGIYTSYQSSSGAAQLEFIHVCMESSRFSIRVNWGQNNNLSGTICTCYHKRDNKNSCTHTQ